MKKYLLPTKNKGSEQESNMSKERYEAMGIRTIALHENGFIEVGLPAGLRIEANKYSSEKRQMFYILDKKNRIRAECYVDDANSWVDFMGRYVPQVVSMGSLKDSETNQEAANQKEANKEEANKEEANKEEINQEAANQEEEELGASAHCGLVVDGHRLGEIRDEDVIYKTAFIDDRLGDKSWELVTNWLDTNYPDWKSANAYWDKE